MTLFWLAPVVNYPQIFLAPFVRMLTTSSCALSQGAPHFLGYGDCAIFTVLAQWSLLTLRRAISPTGCKQLISITQFFSKVDIQ